MYVLPPVMNVLMCCHLLRFVFLRFAFRLSPSAPTPAPACTKLTSLLHAKWLCSFFIIKQNFDLHTYLHIHTHTHTHT